MEHAPASSSMPDNPGDASIRATLRSYRKASQRMVLVMTALIALGLLMLVLAMPEINHQRVALVPTRAWVDELAIEIEVAGRNDLLITEHRTVVVPPEASITTLERLRQGAVSAKDIRQSIAIETLAATRVDQATGELTKLNAPASYDGKSSRWLINLHPDRDKPLGPGKYRYTLQYRVSDAIIRTEGYAHLVWEAPGVSTDPTPRFSLRFIPQAELLEQNLAAHLRSSFVEFDPGSALLFTQARRRVVDGAQFAGAFTRLVERKNRFRESQLAIEFPSKSSLTANEMARLEVTWPLSAEASQGAEVAAETSRREGETAMPATGAS